jgi:hypothetical protein
MSPSNADGSSRGSYRLVMRACSISACLLLVFLGLAKASAEEIVFAVRQPMGPHWYENFGHSVVGEHIKAYGSGGRLGKWNTATGELTVLLDDPEGAVRDPQIHYDGDRILFSYRPGGTHYYHLYEINADGTGLRQLTDGPFDDIEPSYLPDGGIVFCSSRCNRFVPCWYTQVAILYRCDGDGGSIRPLSSNIENDNTPWILGDGRILYTRWEYVDRSREDFHHLWAMNPDGTRQMVFYGNALPGDVYLDAKPVPGTNQVVLVNSPRHGRREHEGRIALLRTDLGPNAPDAQRIIHPGVNFRDPYPWSEDSFLVAQEDTLLRMSVDGETQELFRLPRDWAAGGAWLHEPRPLRPRPREPVIPPAADLGDSTGRLLVADIYHGRHMEGVRRGAVTSLLILENLPKPVNYGGSMDPITYGGSYTLNRVLGTVPVEADGSVYAEVPPLRSLQLVALDQDDRSVKRMLSFLTVMPGEVSSCTGCHEPRTSPPPHASPSALLALRRPPSKIQPVLDTPEIFDYPRDIQPIWDRHCLACHDVDTYAGRALLTGDQGGMFTHSYFTLSARLQIADGRDLARGDYPPYTIGSAASYLMDKVDGSHHDVRLSAAELRRVKLWIDAAATFPGTYAALGSGMIGSYAAVQYGTKPRHDDSHWPALSKAKEVLSRRCSSCHTGARSLPGSPADDLGLRHHHLVYGDGRPRFWIPPWLNANGGGEPKPGSLDWMRQHADPRLQFSRHIVYNFSRPEKSVLLLAPLADSAGGYGICGSVFTSTEAPDYRTLLAGIQEAKEHLESIGRFSLPGFRPEAEYLREMKRYGVLPPDFQATDPIDVYQTDRRYWESLWHQPGDSKRSQPSGQPPVTDQRDDDHADQIHRQAVPAHDARG